MGSYDDYNAKVGMAQDAEVMFVKNGGKIVVESGGTVELQSGALETGKKIYLNAEIPDISTSSSHWVTSPVAGNITKIYSVIDGAITGADAVLTFEIGGVAVTGGTVTIDDSGSAAGIVDSATPTATNTLAAGGALELITNGGSTNTVKSKLTIEITTT